ncbi:prepilin-type N-terminal cleavage/methylation domain-containing protein [uncultured Clostridium sp.]|uniref:prepilin-type N-terminal cleavage/methylation domain-containing protein n=1 Tax=uncultured Clostridium sp. TaxID=59620 RepID=UPI002622A3F4|nr:prepilin-type N-terminal cleavage/methylation domain-containing protein [uncultured Clostridium sp.]
MKRKKRKGFTLIEIIAVIAIIGVFSTLMFSLFSSSTAMLIMAENDNELQNQSRNIIDVLEEDIRFGIDIRIENKLISGVVATESVLILKRKNKVYRYEVEAGELRQYVINEDIEDSESYILNAIPSKYVKKFKVEKVGTKKNSLYKIELEFENGKSNYNYINSIYSMNG